MALLHARPRIARTVDAFISASLAVRVAGLSALQIDLTADIGRSMLPSNTLGRMDAGLTRAVEVPNAIYASLLCWLLRTNRASNTDAEDPYIIDKDFSFAKRSGIPTPRFVLYLETSSAICVTIKIQSGSRNYCYVRSTDTQAIT